MEEGPTNRRRASTHKTVTGVLTFSFFFPQTDLGSDDHCCDAGADADLCLSLKEDARCLPISRTAEAPRLHCSLGILNCMQLFYHSITFIFVHFQRDQTILGLKLVS